MNKAMLVLLFLAFTSAATAAETAVTCSAWVSPVSRALFNNTGTYATTGPAIIAIPECAHVASGIYGNLFLLDPLKNWDVGKEVDVRVGRRFTTGGYDVDISGAWYYFGIGGGTMWQTLDARAKMSRLYDVGTGLTARPYAYADYQHSITNNNDSLGLALGVELNKTLPFLGTPILTIDSSAWYYTTAAAPSLGPIVDLDASLAYKVGKMFVGPRARVVWGDVTQPGNHHPKHIIGAFAVVPF